MSVAAQEHTVSALAQLHHVWTFEDLLELPEDVNWRKWEIVDGALVVSPSTGMRHEIVSLQLRAQLHEAGRPNFVTVGPIAVDLHPSYRIPDLVVVSRETARKTLNPVPVADILTAIEIVSPSSRTADRVTKPAQYAEYGIPTYLRVETEPEITLTAYVLAPGANVYSELRTWSAGEVARLSVPFPVDVEIDALIP